jgi:hypothetical protein
VIRKPQGRQQEDRLHSAVGSVIRTGSEVRSAGRAVQRGARTLSLYYFFGIMGFGLLMSATPVWFKLAVGAGGFLLFKALKGLIARRSANG